MSTVVEVANSGGRLWYDLSAIPPGPGFCTSFEDCKRATNGRKGFNVAIGMMPQNAGRAGGTCRAITCAHEQCEDAYLFPKDDIKTHNCDAANPMKVVFCPGGNGGGGSGPAPAPAPAPTPSLKPVPSPTPNAFAPIADYESGVVNALTPSPPQAQIAKPAAPAPAPQPAPAAAPVPAGNSSSSTFPGAKIKSSFTYKGAKAGNMPGTYGMVTSTQGCVKQTVTVNSPVGPLSEEVSMVFRGPLDIYNIAVYDGSQGGSDWTRVSSYDQAKGDSSNLVFLNNKNIDYVTGVKSPQGLASTDALTAVKSPQQFNGFLREASDPSQRYSGPGITTGAEVNIMTSAKCESTDAVKCKGYYDDNGYHGWNGGKKMFVTKVKMPQGTSPNQPAIWMLNAQVLRSNQYGCNCRGMGGVGGCGELDIAEVIETNDKRDRVTTHYYFYDGSVPAGGDNFAARPINAATTYVTIIDDAGEGTIKILELGETDFDFAATSVAYSQIQSWLNAADVNLLK
jgi:hypothetical protein